MLGTLVSSFNQSQGLNLSTYLRGEVEWWEIFYQRQVAFHSELLPYFLSSAKPLTVSFASLYLFYLFYFFPWRYLAELPSSHILPHFWKVKSILRTPEYIEIEYSVE